jgi:hypothetical protein
VEPSGSSTARGFAAQPANNVTANMIAIARVIAEV